MPPNNGYAHVHSAACKYELAFAGVENEGEYTCKVESSNSSLHPKEAKVAVRLYGEFLSFTTCNQDIVSKFKFLNNLSKKSAVFLYAYLIS